MKHSSSPHRQRGAATLLVVMLIGLGVGVAAVSTVHALKSSQQRELTAHAMTAAQGAAWRGVEVLRSVLQAQGKEKLRTWSGLASNATWSSSCNTGGTTLNLSVTGENQTLGSLHLKEARLVRICREATEDTYQITAQVTGMAGDGNASTTSTVEVVYDLLADGSTIPGGSGSTLPGAAQGAVDIYHDLSMTGGITVAGGDDANINVEGNVNLDSASITGINTLSATGNVSIGSGIHVNTVNANGDVTLSGSASVSNINAGGNVRINGGTNALTIRANGTVTFAGGNGTVVEAIGDVIVTAGGVNISSVKTEGNISWTGTGGGATNLHANGNVVYHGAQKANIVAGGDVTINGAGAASVQADGTVRYTSHGSVDSIVNRGDVYLTGSGSTGSVRTQGNTWLQGSGGITGLMQGQGDLHVNGWQSVGSSSTVGTIGGVLDKTQQWNGSVYVTVQTGYTVAVGTVPEVNVVPVPEFTMAPVNIDVYPLRSASNYIFEHVNGAIRVTVQAVSGIPDGEYVLGTRHYNYNTYPDYLCKAEDMSGTTCNVPVATICEGFSAQNSCFSYSGGQWTVNGKSMARGIAWFDGNLALSNGTYVNTFIATGNIATSGSHRTYAPNYAGYAAVCTNAVPTGTSLTVNSNFNDLVPTNLCDLDAGEMIASTLANVAFIAGGYDESGQYVGGNIDIGASSYVGGSVMAGNLLGTGGSTNIDGRIVVAAQNAGSAPATLSGSTTLNLNNGSTEYQPGTSVPGEGNGTGEESGTPVGTSASVLWSRYL